MAGLLDLFNSDDPVQRQGLLAAAAGLLNASGPSIMPHSLGQVAASGLTGYQAGKQQALDQQKEQMQMAMLQQQVAQATRKNNLINDFLADALGRGQPSAMAGAAAPGMSVASVPSGAAGAAPSASSGTPGFGGVPAAAIAADLAFKNGEHIGEWMNDRSKPTDFTKLLIQAGIDPNSDLGRQVMQQQVFKQNHVPLVAGRAGAPMYNPDGTIAAMAPIIPKNAVPTIENGRVTGVTPLQGAAGVEQINAYADQAGKNQAEPMAGFDASGNPVFTNKLAAASGASWTGGTISAGTLKLLEKSAAAGNKDAQAALAAYQQAQAQRVTPSLAPGVEKSITGNVETMNNDFADLYAANKNAPVTLAILDNIKKLAPKAITGTSADKLAYVNGLLTMGGMQPAKDLASATDLLNKNANMLAINMRLGASGGGSDALQALAQAANPNSHMQTDAIIKAADEVIGQVKMRQGMYQQLLPFKMNNDVQGYYGAQQQFASQADPRTYQPDHAPAAATAPHAPAAPQKFDMLPPAAQFTGRRMRADNGTTYRSDGSKWVKE
ncbi:hypothetical protein SAMN05428966_10246 [Massilia sp. PDC64]|nr:hypothetical protein [Massilia sp. PDC64]SDC65212.1 hypothetical protein SAMN05428966_10246 [Massilia sp. PDC64]